MLFNSYEFLFAFLPAVWVLFRLASRLRWPRVAIAVLVAGSLLFYGYLQPTYIALIAGSIAFNFAWSRLLLRASPPRRWRLAVGVAANLGLLGYFKYTGFALENASALLGVDLSVGEVFLPLGISFFTFQQIAYLVDCHRGLARERDLLGYALFVSFFPQLVAGPIVHHTEMMPQFGNPRTFAFDARNLSIGIAVFSLGLFKKVAIADTLSPWVAAAFDGQGDPQLYCAWVGALSYTFQIYFDFSGYSDMAIGLGHLFNIEIPVNFDSPYRSLSPVEFWRRWHITLSRFLRDYLYIPLGGNRRGPARRYANLMITMLLGGLWHGAAWTFVLWGGVHGLYICACHLWRRAAAALGIALPGALAWSITFVSVVFAWVLFRAPSFDRAVCVLRGMVALNGVEDTADSLLAAGGNTILTWLPFDERALVLPALLAVCLALPASWRWGREMMDGRPIASAVLTASVLAAAVLGMTRVSEFLYFRF